MNNTYYFISKARFSFQKCGLPNFISEPSEHFIFSFISVARSFQTTRVSSTYIYKFTNFFSFTLVALLPQFLNLIRCCRGLQHFRITLISLLNTLSFRQIQFPPCCKQLSSSSYLTNGEIKRRFSFLFAFTYLHKSFVA